MSGVVKYGGSMSVAEELLVDIIAITASFLRLGGGTPPERGDLSVAEWFTATKRAWDDVLADAARRSLDAFEARTR